MNSKVICVRNYRNLVQSDKGNTELHWIKFYPDRLLGSMNFKRCDIREQSLYLAIFIRVRRDGDFCGKLCYSDGKPITFEELLDDMNSKERDRTDLWKQAFQRIIEKTLIYLENSMQTAPPLVEDCSATGMQTGSLLSDDCKMEVLDKQGVIKTGTTDKNKTNTNNKEIDICLSLFAYWNSLPNVLTHRMLTDRIRRAISGRLGEGYTAGELRTMMSNYSEILTGGLLKQYFWTYRWGLTDFLARHKDRFNDIVIARQTFANREQYQDNRVQCSECSGKGKYTLQGTEQRCHKCGGRGYVPDVSKMPKEK